MKQTKTMRRLSALLLALLLSLSLSVPALAAEAAPSVPQTAPAAAKELSGAVQLDWAVWKDGEILASGQEGEPREDPEAGHLRSLAAFGWDPDLYGVGSVSKIYTTVAVMQLAEQGKLDLDQPVVKYLPEFKMADPRYKDITVRMLLNHSSGLMGSSMGSGLLFQDADDTAVSGLLDRLANQRLKADPGAYSVYCNDGFTLAQLVVDRVSDIHFQDYLHANILDPAGLEDTYFPEELLASGEQRDRVVPVYQGEDPESLPMDCLGAVGTGGIYATAEDLAAFGGALTDETLLKASSLEAMAAPEYAKGLWHEGDTGALSYGLGWDCVEWFPFSQSGVTALVKGGDTQYYHAGLVVLPEHRMAAAVVSSGGVSTYNEMAASQLLIAALEAEGVKVDQTPLRLPEAKPAPMPKELTALSGYYGSLYVYKLDVTQDGKLTLHYLNMPGVPDAAFTYYSDGSFRDEDNASAVRLVEEENGQVYLYQWAFSDIPGLGGMPTSNYSAVRLPENKVSQELQDLWTTVMSEVTAVPMNERYSSQVYAVLGASFAMDAVLGGQVELAPGYAGVMKIVDETHARYVPQSPGSTGRDGNDLELRRDEKGVLWMYQSNGSVLMDIQGVPQLSAGKEGRTACTIQPDGYARWYRIGDNTAGKSLAIQVPENAGFWLYDGKGQVVRSTVLGGDHGGILPQGGLIVFAGDPGARFELTFQ